MLNGKVLHAARFPAHTDQLIPILLDMEALKKLLKEANDLAKSLFTSPFLSRVKAKWARRAPAPDTAKRGQECRPYLICSGLACRWLEGRQLSGL